MLRPSYKSVASLAGILALLLSAGCQTAWMDSPDLSHRDRPNRAPADQPVGPMNPSAVNEQSMAAVMDEVREIGQRDPAAQQVLLKQLHRSKPELWPLVVEQFRSSLAYHEQLAAKNSPAAQWPSDRQADTTIRSANWSADGVEKASRPRAASMELRPSAEVGALVDPRGIRPDPAVEESYTTATPANMPPHDPDVDRLAPKSLYAPQPFADTAAARPIQGDHSEQAADQYADRYEPPPSSSSAVELASYTSTSEPDGVSADNQPLGWQQHLELAIDDLSRRASDSPQSTAEVHQQVSLRLLELLAGDTEQALRPVPKISTAEQDYWSHQIFALATYLDHHSQPDDKRRAAASVTHLDEAVGNLRELGTLSLRNLTFCKQVYDYGAYDAYEEPRFSPGGQVTLYVEVENYHSKSTDEGFCTSLGTSYEILDEEGGRVDGGEFPDVEDCCRSRRRDFHIQYGLVLPKAVLPGSYRLELTMKDRLSDKRGHASIAFEIE